MINTSPYRLWYLITIKCLCSFIRWLVMFSALCRCFESSHLFPTWRLFNMIRAGNEVTSHRDVTATGGATGPGEGAPGVCEPSVRCVSAPASRPAARHFRCLRFVWRRRRRRWSRGGRGPAARAGSSSAPCPTCRHPAPPPPRSPTTSLSTAGTGLVRVSSCCYLFRRYITHSMKTNMN